MLVLSSWYSLTIRNCYARIRFYYLFYKNKVLFFKEVDKDAVGQDELSAETNTVSISLQLVGGDW